MLLNAYNGLQASEIDTSSMFGQQKKRSMAKAASTVAGSVFLGESTWWTGRHKWSYPESCFSRPGSHRKGIFISVPILPYEPPESLDII